MPWILKHRAQIAWISYSVLLKYLFITKAFMPRNVVERLFANQTKLIWNWLWLHNNELFLLLHCTHTHTAKASRIFTQFIPRNCPCLAFDFYKINKLIKEMWRRRYLNQENRLNVRTFGLTGPNLYPNIGHYPSVS